MKFHTLPLLVLLAFFAAHTDAQSTAKGFAQSGLSKTTHSNTRGDLTDFTQWKDVSAFIDDMVLKHGFNRSEIESVLRQARHIDRVIQLIKPAPTDQPKNWTAYRARFIDPIRINAGIAFWNMHEKALMRAEKQYGVPAEIIVGILGVETIYGRNTGKFRVIDAIATLAFAYPDTPTRQARMDYFRGELESALLIARDTNIDPFTLLGSYAGAIGLPQFMPSSILRYAVDFDDDDRIDLRHSPTDAIGSVANFLAQHGWKANQPIVFPAKINISENEKSPSWQQFIGQNLDARYHLDELKEHGIVPTTSLPANLNYGLIDLQNGPNPTEYWLGTDNFFAITRYNRSFFYAMSVTDLGHTIRLVREHATRNNRQLLSPDSGLNTSIPSTP